VSLTGGDLDHFGVPVASRELHDAQPIAPERKAERFGVNRHRVAESPVGGQIVTMESDSHGSLVVIENTKV
jgi:hypothetical protein